MIFEDVAPAPSGSARARLRSDLLRLFEAGAAAALPDDDFDALALRVFRHQLARNPPYAAFCRRRGVDGDSAGGWREIPAVPTAAFKEVALLAGDPADAQAVFRTSGTTRGPEKRGEHYLLDLSLYRASLRPTFHHYVLAGRGGMPMLSLVPPAASMPDSSLAFMVEEVIAAFGGEGSGHFAHPDHGIQADRLHASLERAVSRDAPVCLLGTSLAFVRWLELLEAGRPRFRLPAGSRIMDTGGFKGVRGAMSPEGALARYHDLLGVPASHVVNEYGMTEMCSQLYDTAIADGSTPGPARLKRGPPWVRTTVVDADTLRPLPHGERGLLRHVDLANLDSVVAVQTEDVGVERPGGVELHGRAAGAAPRGCSIAMELLFDALGEERR